MIEDLRRSGSKGPRSLTPGVFFPSRLAFNSAQPAFLKSWVPVLSVSSLIHTDARRDVNTGVKVHQRIAVKIHQPEEEGSGVWSLAGGARGGLPPRRVIEDLIS